MQIGQSLLQALKECHHLLERWFGGSGLAAQAETRGFGFPNAHTYIVEHFCNPNAVGRHRLILGRSLGSQYSQSGKTENSKFRSERLYHKKVRRRTSGCQSLAIHTRDE